MKLKTFLYSQRIAKFFGVGFVLAICAYGVALGLERPTPVSPVGPANANFTVKGTGVKADLFLSQTKIVQGDDGQVYLKMVLESDAVAIASGERKPTDFVVVLDRSGSMSEKNKMDYAHKAIASLIQQMNASDRFAMVTFDSRVETPIALQFTKSENKNELIAKVNQVTPRGGTDLASGLVEGVAFLKGANSDKKRAKRLILISDGHANVGETNPHVIGQMIKKESSGEFAISTLGVGLDYNERLLANVADHGMGNYHYLSQLSAMDKILEDEFYSASRIVVQNLMIRFKAGDVKLADASGYPIELKNGFYEIKPGHLYEKQKKVLYLNLAVPTDKVQSYQLSEAVLSYDFKETNHRVDLLEKPILLACLEKEKRDEAKASIEKDVFADAWNNYEYGGLLKSASSDVQTGAKGKARSKISNYKKRLQKALSEAPSPKLQQQMADLEKMEEDIDAAEDEVAQKSLGKGYHYKGNVSTRK